jgi:hypothetical protein
MLHNTLSQRGVSGGGGGGGESAAYSRTALLARHLYLHSKHINVLNAFVKASVILIYLYRCISCAVYCKREELSR